MHFAFRLRLQLCFGGKGSSESKLSESGLKVATAVKVSIMAQIKVVENLFAPDLSSFLLMH